MFDAVYLAWLSRMPNVNTPLDEWSVSKLDGDPGANLQPKSGVAEEAKKRHQESFLEIFIPSYYYENLQTFPKRAFRMNCSGHTLRTWENSLRILPNSVTVQQRPKPKFDRCRVSTC